MSNNIKRVLESKGISINELSRLIEKDYPTTHALVTRKSLNNTTLDTLIKVSDVLGTDIETLYTDDIRKIEVIDLFNRNYAGGLSVLALRTYKDEIEQVLSEKLKRSIILIYEYKSTINMGGVDDKLKLEIIIADDEDEDDKYCFYFKGKSINLSLKDRLMESIENCINEYEIGIYEDIEKLYNDLNRENMYPNLMKLEKIEIEEI